MSDTVVWVREISRGGNLANSGQETVDQHTTKYLVKVTGPNISRTTIITTTPGLPRYASPHPENPGAGCVRLDAQRSQKDPLIWEVTADWSDQQTDISLSNLQPDLRRAKWSRRFVGMPQHLFCDFDGKLMADAAGSPFDPVPEISIAALEITVRRYEGISSISLDRQFMFATNAYPWLGCDRGTALVQNIDQAEEFIGGYYWLARTYTILVKPRYWAMAPKGTPFAIGGFNPEYILNAGPYQLKDGKDDAGNPIKLQEPIKHTGYYDSRPNYLYGDGDTDPKTGASTKGKLIPRAADGSYDVDPRWLAFRTKLVADFSPMALIPPSNWVI